MRQFTIWLAALIPVTGCSVFDALQGPPGPPIPDAGECPDPSNPECPDVEQFSCMSPFVVPDGVGEINVDGCGQTPSEPPDACGQGFGEDAVFKLDVRSGMYTLCVSGPPGSSFSLVPDCMSPGNNATCLLADGCLDVFVTSGEFAIWHANDLGRCGSISLSAFPLNLGAPHDLDGLNGGRNPLSP